MTRFHIVVSDHLHPAGWRALEQAPDASFSGPYDSRAEVLAALGDADALIIRSTTQVDAVLLDAAPNLKVAARAGAQLNNVDIDDATRRGIMVINVPRVNIVAVTEHTFAMLLALARHLPQGYDEIHRGEWRRHQILGFELHGKTLGIVGFGRIGREVAARAQAFGMHVLAYDPYVDLAEARERNVEVVNFAELLGRADIVTVHTAVTPQTRDMFNAEVFRSMKPGAYLVNCTHADLIDEAALLAALDDGHLAGAALDTLKQEPPAADHPLAYHKKIVVAPHLHQNTVETQVQTSVQVVEDVLAALRQDDYRDVVNLPFSEEVPYRRVRPYVNLAAKLGKLQGQLAGGWITRLEVDLLGEGVRRLVRPVAAALLTGMLLPVDGRAANWVSAPVLAYEQGIVTSRVKGLCAASEYPNLIACRIYWQGGEPGQPGGQRTVAGVLFANGEARLVLYDDVPIDAHPEGYVLILENDDVPGVIGKVGTQLGQAGINIGQWRYGRNAPNQRAVSFINLDARPPQSLLDELTHHAEIQSARLVRL